MARIDQDDQMSGEDDLASSKRIDTSPSFLSRTQQLLLTFLSLGPVPKHIALLLNSDGSNKADQGQSFRAAQRFLHWAATVGCQTVTLHFCAIAGLRGRCSDELEVFNSLWRETDRYLEGEDEIVPDGCIIKFCGKRELLPELIQAAMKRVEFLSERRKNLSAFHLNFTVAYSSSEEIAQAIQQVQNRIVDRSLALLASITREVVMENTYFTYFPPPDLVLCTNEGNCFRNFMLFQSENALIVSAQNALYKFVSFFYVMLLYQLSFDARDNYDYNLETLKRKAKRKKRKRRMGKYAALRGLGFMFLAAVAYFVYLRFSGVSYRV